MIEENYSCDGSNRVGNPCPRIQEGVAKMVQKMMIMDKILFLKSGVVGQLREHRGLRPNETESDGSWRRSEERGDVQILTMSTAESYQDEGVGSDAQLQQWQICRVPEQCQLMF